MNHMLIVITYYAPGHNPVITSAVMPINQVTSFDMHKRNIEEQYRNKKYYDVTITQV